MTSIYLQLFFLFLTLRLIVCTGVSIGQQIWILGKRVRSQLSFLEQKNKTKQNKTKQNKWRTYDEFTFHALICIARKESSQSKKSIASPGTMRSWCHTKCLSSHVSTSVLQRLFVQSLFVFRMLRFSPCVWRSAGITSLPSNKKAQTHKISTSLPPTPFLTWSFMELTVVLSAMLPV